MLATGALLLQGCGGGGGSSGGPAPTPGVTPAPAPAPAPAPTPAAAFSAVAIGPFVTAVTLDTSGDGLFVGGDAATRTTLAGLFGVGVSTATNGTLPTVANVRLATSFGLDATTGLVFSGMTAPAGATVVSPLTSLIDAGASEQAVRAALSLDVGSDALRADTGLLRFDPAANLASSDARTVEDAARITSINLQLLALAAVAKDTNGDPVDFAVPLAESSRYLAQVIAATGNGRLSDPAVVRAILDRSRQAVGAPSDQLAALSSLLARYFAAVPRRISSASVARGWAYAFRFYVFPEFKRLASQWPNPEAARIGAISDTDIAAAAVTFANAPAPLLTNFVAVPDYRELTAQTLPSYTMTLAGCDSLLTRAPVCNDLTLVLGTGLSARVVSVGNFDPAKVAVSLSADGTVVVSRSGNYIGPASFTYVSRSQAGEESTGTVYLTVR
ncbi:MAG: hypothetical protein ABW194_08790 [Novosphingobium sp.]